MPNPIHFPPNVPQILSLSDPAGVPNGFNVEYPTTDGRVLSLPRATAVRLNLLDLKPGETFGICHRTSDSIPVRVRDVAEWDLWLTPETEQKRAREEAMQTERLETVDPERTGGTVANQREEVMPTDTSAKPRGARNSDDGVKQKRTPRKLKEHRTHALAARESTAFDLHTSLLPTGTDGASPKLATMKRTRVGAIPINIAFGEIIEWMKAGLDAHHLQWGDAAQQDFVSTAIIGGMKQGWITMWER
jgi:hypothetical protein